MPEYGLCDKSPEEIEEERLNKELCAAFGRAEAIEAVARQRKTDAENSNIETAKMLRQMMGQVQEIRNTQMVEQQAQISAEVKAAKDTEKQRRTDKARFIFTATIGILSFIVGSIAAVAAVLALIPR